MPQMNIKQNRNKENRVKLLLLGRAASKDDHGTIDRKQLGQLLSLDNDKVRITSTTSKCPSIFPLDIWLELFPFLDIRTLTLLRCVCRSFRDMISNYPAYSLLYHNVPYLIRASLITGTGSFISLSQLYAAYLSIKCAFDGCINDAEYIYLLTADRVCFVHLREIKQVVMARKLKKAVNDCGIALGSLPLIRPVMQTPNRTLYIDERTLALLRQTTTLPAWTATSPARVFGTGHGDHCLKSCLKTPWLDVTTKKNEWGYQCSYCAGNVEDPRPWSNLTHTPEGMLKHFEDCLAARARWEEFIAKNDESGKN